MFHDFGYGSTRITGPGWKEMQAIRTDRPGENRRIQTEGIAERQVRKNKFATKEEIIH